MSSPEDRLLKALWGKPEVMYDRRQTPTRRKSWRGGRRATDWPETFAASNASTCRPRKAQRRNITH
jgi:hypothetical protein